MTPAPMDGRRDLEVLSVSKAYSGPDVVRDLTFTLRQGEFLTLLGPSGSGKTTTLLMVAGFERPTAGDVRIGGRSIVNDPPQRRNFGIVFQSYALFPHMTVLENVEFPLRMRRVAKRDRRTPALDMLDKVGLGGLESRKPRELSGGQQQRVAVARALVFDPDALLLDEPLGALDKRLRESMQIEIKAIQRRVGISILYVTHDQEEAMVMSDRIAIMREGRIVQIGSPTDLYKHPQTPFAASFLGETNLLPCRGTGQDGGDGRVVFADEEITRFPAHEIVIRGIALAPEGRHCFARMSVRENLDLGAFRRQGGGVGEDLERVFELFPRLKERERQKAGTMSGGEQQMLAIGRALMARPKLLMLDEPSMGIAPILVQRIYETIRVINRQGVAILLVEQNANYALEIARRGYVLETGQVVLAKDSVELRDDPAVQKAYLGT